jgi:hypothetical protein
LASYSVPAAVQPGILEGSFLPGKRRLPLSRRTLNKSAISLQPSALSFFCS